MVRGCQKRMVYLKSTGSEVFDEAYFVVRDDALVNFGECDMIKEANRILSECVSLDENVSPWQTLWVFIKGKIIPLFVGILIGILLAILIK